MTVHAVHPDTHEHGLADDCDRCAELAADPVRTLDHINLGRIMRLAVDEDRLANPSTHNDMVAAARVLTALEHAGHLARTDPQIVCDFLARYGVHVHPVVRL